MEHISSRQNPLVKRFRELARERGDDGAMLLEGMHLLDEACASGVELSVAAFASDVAAGAMNELAARASEHGARIVTMPPSVLSSASPVQTASGVLAIGRAPQLTVADVLSRAPQLVLILDGVQDPGNVGAIVRTAEACGATGILVGPGTADPFGWKALRGAMGSTFRLPVVVLGSLEEAVRAARASGLRIYATVARDGTPLRMLDLRGPAAILLGREGGGIPDAIVAAADERLTIEMHAPVESLNVATAAALIVYEAARQRADVAVR